MSQVRLEIKEPPRPTVEDLRVLANRYQAELEHERTRLAHELHDNLTQKLTVVSLELSLIHNGIQADEDVSRAQLLEKVKEVTELVNDLITSLRQIKGELRPKVLDEFGLVAALEWEGKEFERTTGIRCVVRSDPEEVLTEPQVATQLFRVFQEILNNVWKHASARRVETVVQQRNGQISLSVADDGVGIAAAAAQSTSASGLLDLRERVTMLQGALAISGSPGQGTKIQIVVPDNIRAGIRPASQNHEYDAGLNH